MTNTTKTVACSCGILSGTAHPVGRSEEFGGETATWDNGYNAAHGVAEAARADGYEARVYSEPGFGWAVQVRKKSALACRGCGVAIPGPRLFCEPCFQAMLARSDEALRSRPAPRGGFETHEQAEAARRPGQGIVRVRPGMGHGPAGYILVGKAVA
jgi:hypothetical protein